MSKPKSGYRLASPEERVLINRLGTCWVIRVWGEHASTACPNPRLEGLDVCEHHCRTDPLRSHEQEEEQIEQDEEVAE